MREVIDEIDAWLSVDNPIALATVVKTWGSAPRKAGAKLALTQSGAMAGSVSGGCVEGAVVESGIEGLASNKPQLLTYGVADETAWEVGLACGGSVSVFVEPLNQEFYNISRGWLEANQSGAIATVIKSVDDSLLGKKLAVDHLGTVTGLISDRIDEEITQLCAEALQTRKTKLVSLTDDLDLFIDVILPPPTLIMVGGVHISVALVGMAKAVGFHTIVIDPRRAFASAERFAHADQLMQTWPQKAFPELILNGSTAVCLLTHDPKIDDPALEIIKDSPIFYIGALGSRRTHAKRIERLKACGWSDAQIERISAPIGLDINAQTPEEIALSIMGEIINDYR